MVECPEGIRELQKGNLIRVGADMQQTDQKEPDERVPECRQLC